MCVWRGRSVEKYRTLGSAISLSLPLEELEGGLETDVRATASGERAVIDDLLCRRGWLLFLANLFWSRTRGTCLGSTYSCSLKLREATQGR
jgi:hypothetical protein